MILFSLTIIEAIRILVKFASYWSIEYLCLNYISRILLFLVVILTAIRYFQGMMMLANYPQVQQLYEKDVNLHRILIIHGPIWTMVPFFSLAHFQERLGYFIISLLLIAGPGLSLEMHWVKRCEGFKLYQLKKIAQVWRNIDSIVFGVGIILLVCYWKDIISFNTCSIVLFFLTLFSFMGDICYWNSDFYLNPMKAY